MLLRCDSITPFGRPVVPLVNRMTNGSSSSMATSGNARVGRVPPRAPAKSRSNSTTGSPSASSTPSRRSSRRRSPNSTFGSVSSTAYAISSPVHQPLSPTVIAPSAVVAQNASAYSTVLGATMATRSPGPDRRSSSRSAAATAAIGCRIDANVYSPVGEDHVRPITQSLRPRPRSSSTSDLRAVGEHEHRRAEHRPPRAARTGAPGPVSVVEDGFGDGLRRPDERRHAGRRCDSSTPLSRITRLRVLGA